MLLHERNQRRDHLISRLVPEILTTHRLRLRRPTIADVADVFAYAADTEVTRFMDWPVHKEMNKVIEWVFECTSLWESRAEFTWVMTLPPDERVIGAVSLRVSDYKAEFGYVLNRE